MGGLSLGELTTLKTGEKTIRDSRTGNVIRLGIPQRRRRISVVADFGGESAAQIQFDRESVSGHPAESGAAGEGLAGAPEIGASYAVRIRGVCDGGGKGALVQTEKSGTLGTGNDQTIFCLQGNGMQQQEAQIRAQSEKWYMEAEAMRGNPMYQNFDLVQELQNDEFVNLLKAGTPMEHAYKVLHFDELMGNAVQAAAASTEKKVADNVRAKGSRPSENGTSSNSAFVTKTDPSKLTRADFEEIERRVARGERISF